MNVWDFADGAINYTQYFIFNASRQQVWLDRPAAIALTLLALSGLVAAVLFVIFQLRKK